jgi:hypothetical protein
MRRNEQQIVRCAASYWPATRREGDGGRQYPQVARLRIVPEKIRSSASLEAGAPAPGILPGSIFRWPIETIEIVWRLLPAGDEQLGIRQMSEANVEFERTLGDYIFQHS